MDALVQPSAGLRGQLLRSFPLHGLLLVTSFDRATSSGNVEGVDDDATRAKPQPQLALVRAPSNRHREAEDIDTSPKADKPPHQLTQMASRTISADLEGPAEAGEEWPAEAPPLPLTSAVTAAGRPSGMEAGGPPSPPPLQAEADVSSDEVVWRATTAIISPFGSLAQAAPPVKGNRFNIVASTGTFEPKKAARTVKPPAEEVPHHVWVDFEMEFNRAAAEFNAEKQRVPAVKDPAVALREQQARRAVWAADWERYVDAYPQLLAAAEAAEAAEELAKERLREQRELERELERKEVPIFMQHMAAQTLSKLARTVIPGLTPQLARQVTLEDLEMQADADGNSDKLRALFADYPLLKEGIAGLLFGRSCGNDIDAVSPLFLTQFESPWLSCHLCRIIIRGQRGLECVDRGLVFPALQVLACLIDLKEQLGEPLFISTEAEAAGGPSAVAVDQEESSREVALQWEAEERECCRDMRQTIKEGLGW